MDEILKKLENDAKKANDDKLKYYKELAEELLKYFAFYVVKLNDDGQFNTYIKMMLDYYLRIFRDNRIVLVGAYITQKGNKLKVIETYSYGDAKKQRKLNNILVFIPKNQDYWPDVLKECDVKTFNITTEYNTEHENNSSNA